MLTKTRRHKTEIVVALCLLNDSAAANRARWEAKKTNLR